MFEALERLKALEVVFRLGSLPHCDKILLTNDCAKAQPPWHES